MHDKNELEAAHKALLSTLRKCEKVDESTNLPQSQRTLLTRRIAALKMALELIEEELGKSKEQNA
ncbi:MAG TPA: hypothetical protein PKD55_12325 [Bellilinea sp.]|nr:hypothetical protein [Bellilinea sp.]